MPKSEKHNIPKDNQPEHGEATNPALEQSPTKQAPGAEGPTDASANTDHNPSQGSPSIRKSPGTAD